MRLRGTIAALSILFLTALALAGCSTGGTSTTGAGGGSTSGSGGNSAGTAASASFSGDLSGTIAMNLCNDSGDDSVFFIIGGTKYPGLVSADQLSFVGPDAKDWILDKSAGAVPVAITSGSGGYTVDGVHVHYELAGDTTQTITVSGKLLCP
jgi:hypothetical protein